jgi:hypothetical protein
MVHDEPFSLFYSFLILGHSPWERDQPADTYTGEHNVYNTLIRCGDKIKDFLNVEGYGTCNSYCASKD